MKAHALVLKGFIFALAAGALAPVTWAGEVKAREGHQQDRVQQGVASGQLTGKETANLEKGEAKIERDREKALADGKMTPKEKKKLNREEHKESKKIFAKKHNKKTR